MTFTIVTWITSILATIGVILNIQKRRSCFYLWAVTNATWCAIDFYKGIYAQSALFFLYFILALWGIWKWKA